MNFKRSQPRGIAYVLVLAVVALATLIGYAMLSGASLQAEASTNFAHSAAADYLTESAVQTAAYYLQRDLAGMPASWVQAGYKLRAQNVTVSGIDGSFDVDATTNSQADGYDIHVTARNSGNSAVTRTSTAKVRVVRVSPTYAVGIPGAVTINARNYFNGGAVATSGGITIVGLPLFNGGTRSFNTGEFAAPSPAQLNYYGGATGSYTCPNGRVGYPQVLSSGTISSPSTLSVAANNPGKIFYYGSDVYLTGAGTYEGTIIARGKLEVKFPSTTGGTVVINRQSGFPAVMADGTVTMNSKNVTMNINGLVYAGGGTSFTNLNCSGSTVTIYGSLLIPGGKTMGNGNQGTMIVNYTPANLGVDNLTTVVQTPQSVQFLDWKQ